MNLVFTLDDGLKSQMQFWNRVVKPATYFILPLSSSFGWTDKETTGGFCGWSDIRSLAKNNDIGFHEYYITERMTDEVVDMGIGFQKMLFKQEIGQIPLTFAYSDMRPMKLGLINKHFPYVRDYFWRDYNKDTQSYDFRIPDKEVPESMKPYREKIFCLHPMFDIVLMLKKLSNLEEQGIEYCVFIFHHIEDKHVFIARAVSQVYPVITFREIFEGQSEIADKKVSSVPIVGSVVTQTGATPVVSPAKETKVENSGS